MTSNAMPFSKERPDSDGYRLEDSEGFSGNSSSTVGLNAPISVDALLVLD
jgi:hypothetical protein